MAQVAEHILGKDEVPGPNPGSSSKSPGCFSSGAFLRDFFRVMIRRGILFVRHSFRARQERTSAAGGGGLLLPDSKEKLFPVISGGFCHFHLRHLLHPFFRVFRYGCGQKRFPSQTGDFSPARDGKRFAFPEDGHLCVIPDSFAPSGLHRCSRKFR